ncbi:MAG: hypothetical protein GTO18_14610 [Anaerolineales bacterium]|nr:hypothetical protein [Anaerolineales bacterium]
MVWKILRPHYWSLDRKVRTTNRFILFGLFMLVCFGGQWVYDNMIHDYLALLNSEQAVNAIALALPLGFFVILLFAMLGVGDVLHHLYLASDLELLMVAPIPYRTIFLVKLLQSSRATLIPALSFGVLQLALGLAREAAMSFYILIGLLTLASMTLATAAIMILVILLARLLPAQKIRSWMPVVVTLMTFVLVLSQEPVTQRLLSHANLITFLTEALLDPVRLGQVVTVFIGLATVTSLVAYRIFNTSFHEGWNRFHEVPTRRKTVSLAPHRARGAPRLLRTVSAPLRCFLIKEWLDLRRNPRGLIALAQPVTLVAVVLIPFLSGGRGADTLRPLIFWLMVVFLMVFLSIMPLGTSLMAVAQEGRKVSLLRSLPISMSAVLKGKFWSTWVPMVLSWAVILLIAGLWLQFPLWQIGFLVGITILGLTGTAIMTVAVGGLRVDFTVEELKQRIPTLTSYLLMGINFIFVLLIITVSVWFMVRLFPDSHVVQALQALSGYGAVEWVFSDKMWVPFALMGSQLIFWMSVKRLWNAAIHRLEGWEEI